MNAKQVMREVAKEHGVTYQEVYSGIQEWIDFTYQNNTDLARTIRKSCPTKNGKPTPEQYIAFLAQYAGNQLPLLIPRS